MDRVVLAPCFRGHYTHLVEIDEYANLYEMDEEDKTPKRAALVEWLAQVIIAATTALEPCGYDTEKQRQLMEEVKKENKGQNFWWGLSRYDEEEYRRVEDAEERAEMAELSEQDKQEISDFFAENKRLKRVCASVEESFRAVVAEIWAQANKIDQLQAENEELKLKTDADMTKPQPCTRFRNAGTVEWIAKLMEETNEAIQEAYTVSQLEQTNKKAPCEAMDEVLQNARERLAMELTDVKTLCES